MILKSIELENIRSYDKEKIEFPRGITLFEGDIGSGKSSVLMAIEFALFGLGSQKPESILSKRANEGSVILNFEVEGKNCEIRRTLKRKDESVSQDPKHSYLKINDVLEPLSPTELKQRILQILNFNEPGDPRAESKIFRYAIFTPQEEMKQILYDSTKRLETIRKAFGVEDYKIAVENSRNFSGFIKNKVEVFRERFKDLSKYELELKNIEKRSNEITKTVEEHKLKEDTLKQKKSDVKSELDKLREMTKQSIKLIERIKNMEKQIKDKQDSLNKITENLNKFVDEIEELESELKIQKNVEKPTMKSMEKINKLIKTCSDSETKITSLESRENTLLEQKKSLEKRLGKYIELDFDSLNSKNNQLREKIKQEKLQHKKLESEIKEKTKTRTRLETNIESIENSVTDLEKMGSKCPYCENKLTSEHKENLANERKERLKEFKHEFESILKELEVLAKTHIQTEESISKLEEETNEIDRILPDLNGYAVMDEELNSISTELNSMKKERSLFEDRSFDKISKYNTPLEYLISLRDSLSKYQNAEMEIKKIEKQIQKYTETKKEKDEELKLKSSEVKNLRDELDTLIKENKKFEGLENKIQELEDRESEYELELRKTTNSLAAMDQEMKNNNDRLEEYTEKISNSNKWKSAHRKYSNYHEWIQKFFIPALELIEKQVLLSIQQDFNETYRRWYSILIDDPTKESRIDENFTPIIEQDGYDQNIDYLSGGEKTSIALAYRLTLNSLMRKESHSMKSNLLILDEPTDGFSKTQLFKVKTLLLELKSPQIILVSHEKELETYVDNIFQISKAGGISRIIRTNN